AVRALAAAGIPKDAIATQLKISTETVTEILDSQD
ncbi:MAG: hypothetical protein RJB13_2050, partial [Pseudomonadota bacterium]